MRAWRKHLVVLSAACLLSACSGWQSTLGKRFTTDELERIVDFLRASVEIGRRQLERLRQTS